MNIKWLGRKYFFDTNSLQVEWLGTEDANQEFKRRWLRNVRFSREKSRDLSVRRVWDLGPSIFGNRI